MKIAELSLTNICNFSCDYCKSEASHIRDIRGKGWDFAGAIVDFAPWLKFVREHLHGYILLVTGGEPLIVQGIAQFVNDLSETNHVIVTTNGSSLGAVYPRINPNVKFRISLHPEQRTPAPFLNSIQHLEKSNILVNYVLHPRHIECGKYFEYISLLSSSRIPFEVTNFDGMYKGEAFHNLHPIYEGLITPREPMADSLEIVVVWPDGRIYSCHGKHTEDGCIGSIHMGDFDKKKTCSHRCRFVDMTSLCPMFDAVPRITGSH